MQQPKPKSDVFVGERKYHCMG